MLQCGQKWGLLQTLHMLQCGEEVGTSSPQCSMLQCGEEVGTSSDSAACECGEEVGTGGQCSM